MGVDRTLIGLGLYSRGDARSDQAVSVRTERRCQVSDMRKLDELSYRSPKRATLAVAADYYSLQGVAGGERRVLGNESAQSGYGGRSSEKLLAEH